MKRRPVWMVCFLGIGLLLGLSGGEKGHSADTPAAVVPSPVPEPVKLPPPDSQGWIWLFHGKDLKGWYGDPEVWRVVQGCICGKAEKVAHNTFLIYNHPFADFELVLQCRLRKGRGFTNSGIQYRSRVLDAKKWIVGGYQADIGPGYWGTLYEERGRGSLGKKLPGAKEPGDGVWVEYRIRAQGNHLQHYLDGVPTVDFVDKDAQKAAREGIIALQYHAPGQGFEVCFKDIRLKVLSP